MVREMGPLPVSETPFGGAQKPSTLRTQLQRHGSVAYLWPTASNRTYERSYSPTFAHDPVLYHETHEPRAAIETWLDANPQILDRASAWAVYMSLRFSDIDDRLTDAAIGVLRERDPEGWRGGTDR